MISQYFLQYFLFFSLNFVVIFFEGFVGELGYVCFDDFVLIVWIEGFVCIYF